MTLKVMEDIMMSIDICGNNVFGHCYAQNAVEVYQSESRCCQRFAKVYLLNNEIYLNEQQCTEKFEWCVNNE